VVEIEAQANSLDEIGRVIDFSVLRNRIGSWLDINWDHGFLVFSEDTEVLAALKAVPGQKYFPLAMNPTAENLAVFLLETLCPNALMDTGVKVTRVVVHETENCKAEARA
jgi:6-pyruvoyltetrahydropterin/6-carboxytetrahydropterin synthase